MLVHIDKFGRTGDDINRDVIVAAVFKNDESTVNPIEDQIQSEISIRHGDDGIDGVRIASSD